MTQTARGMSATVENVRGQPGRVASREELAGEDSLVEHQHRRPAVTIRKVQTGQVMPDGSWSSRCELGTSSA